MTVSVYIFGTANNLVLSSQYVLSTFYLRQYYKYIHLFPTSWLHNRSKMRSAKSGRVKLNVLWKRILTLLILSRELTKKRSKSLRGAHSHI